MPRVEDHHIGLCSSGSPPPLINKAVSYIIVSIQKYHPLSTMNS
ncbi:hypothetical protein yberc0001_9260 [Yersinia bercovieri ATCC 43970]|uniref:Uncharacterized protein n=1 Tax=Yersinia bercovieri ATCC 43970 TaxID=349968 RepID=A0ABM9XXE7_YERBE|nr:hypothetical protein yberc0001_9260 [Yersinia bercovieri ATCC 43970]